jgi:hypothetical protein
MNIGGKSRFGRRRSVRIVAAASLAAGSVAASTAISSKESEAWSGFVCSFHDYANTVDPIPYSVNNSGGYDGIITDAVNSWNGSSAGTYINLQPPSYYYQIRIYVQNYGNLSWSGQVDEYDCNAWNGDWNFPPRMRINRYHTDDYKAVDAMGVIVHEFGHAIGLGHVSNSCGANSVMVPYDDKRWECGFQNPQGDDIVGVSSLYPSYK